MADSRQDATSVARAVSSLGILVVVASATVVAVKTGVSLGAFAIPALPAIPLVWTFRGRPAKTHIAVISSLLIAGTTVAFVVVYLRDTHSTAALWFMDSIAVTWGIWGLSAWTDTNGLP